MGLRYKARMPCVICKLDLEKVYERVDWDFLWYNLWHMEPDKEIGTAVLESAE